MKRAMLPLSALRAFDAAARHQSFKDAAEELAVTPAAISQQVRHLEAVIGRQLFFRSNRQLTLTPWAEASMDEVAKAFEILERSVRLMNGEEELPEATVYRLSA